MAQHLKNEIKQVLSSLNLFLTKLPKPKQMQYLNEIRTMVSQRDAENEKVLKETLNQLQYRYNFLRLTNPQILKQIEKEKAESKAQEEAGEKAEGPIFGNPSEQVDETVTSQEESKAEESNKLKSGKYVLKDGKLVEGEATKRAYVEFSNWYAANVDPDDLKKHKELLDRQHFRGPMWNGQKPKSIMDEENPLINMDVDPEPNPSLLKPKPDSFEVVKR